MTGYKRRTENRNNLSCKSILHVNSIFTQFVTFDNYELSPNHLPEVTISKILPFYDI